MKNVYLIPTDKPSRLCIDNSCNELNYSEKEGLNSKHITNQCIYVTNSEEIKQGDFFYLDDAKIIAKYSNGCLIKEVEKIILTTDSKLIANGVQEINDEFLEWFIQNPTCEYVKIESWETKGEWDLDYKIIIPKQNQITLEDVDKQIAITENRGEKIVDYLKLYEGQSIYKEIALAIEFGYQLRLSEELMEENQTDPETVEKSFIEASKKYGKQVVDSRKNLDLTFNEKIWLSGGCIQGFQEGAKWQQERSYSEEDLKEAFKGGGKMSWTDISQETQEPYYYDFQEWFNEIKKK